MRSKTIKQLCEELNFNKELTEHLENVELGYEVIRKKENSDINMVQWLMNSIEDVKKNTNLLEGLTLREQILFNIGTLQGLVEEMLS